MEIHINSHTDKHSQDKTETLDRVLDNYMYNLKHPHAKQKTTMNTRFISTTYRTPQEQIKYYAKRIAEDNKHVIDAWLGKPHSQALILQGLAEEDVVGTGYLITDKNKLQLRTTNLIRMCLEKTTDELGYEIKSIYPTISYNSLEQFQKTNPADAKSVIIKPTDNPKIFNHLLDTNTYKGASTVKDKNTIAKLRPAKTKKEHNEYKDPYRSYAMEESKRKPTMSEYMARIHAKPTTPKTNEPDFK